MNIPNLITLGRILLVPVVVWAIATPGAMWIAFVLFLAAGVSDAVDGFLAKRFNMTTELGAYLDPLADKALIVSIYLTLGINGLIPRWLVILVVSRDIMIVGGIMLSWLVGNPLKIKPLLVSKLNTVAQIVFACVVLGSLGFNYEWPTLTLVLMGLVAVLTLLSVAAYVAEWVRHMNTTASGPVSPRARPRPRRDPPEGDGMPSERQVVFWLAALAVIVLLLWLLSEILLPFVAGTAIAYLLTPVTDRLERLGVNRLAAALSMITLVVMAIVLLILLVAPILGGQLSSFIDNIPGYVTRLQSLLSDPSRPWLQKILGASFSADKSMGDLVTQGVGWLTTFLQSLWSGGRALVSLFSLVVVTPVVAFYLIYDWHRMIRTVDGWIPVNQRETVRQLAREIDAAIAGFVRGQTAVCLILGSFYAVALTLSGLNFGLLIGLISGVITFIPYVGSMTGLILALGVAVAQFWPDYSSILMVLGIFLVGQFLEGNLLAPKLVGESVGLHPVWLIFALLAFGYLFGFVGLLVAVPLAATIGVLARFALQRYRASSLYTGEPPG